MYIKNRGELPRGDPYDVILDALEAALDAADPYKAVASALAREGGEFKKFAGVHVRTPDMLPLYRRHSKLVKI